MKTEFIRIEIT